MNHRSNYLKAAAVVLALSVAGCRTSPSARYYVLSAKPRQQAPLEGAVGGELTIGVNPVEIPEYLNRTQMVTRIGDGGARIDEFDRWAEPLDDAIERLIVEYLTAGLDTEHVVVRPTRGFHRFDYIVTANVVSFDVWQDGSMLVDIRWAIFRGERDENPDLFRCVQQSENDRAPTGDRGPVVLGLRESIATCVDQLAETILRIERTAD